MDISTIPSVVSYIVVAVMISILVYVITTTFSIVAVITALFFTIGVVMINPKISDNIKKNPCIVYYGLFLMVTLLFSIEHCKKNRDLVALVVVAVLIGVITLYAITPIMIYLTIFTSVYVVARILIVFLYKEDVIST